MASSSDSQKKPLVPRDAELRRLLDRCPLPTQELPSRRYSKTKPPSWDGPLALRFDDVQTKFWQHAERNNLPVTVLLSTNASMAYSTQRLTIPILGRSSLSRAFAKPSTREKADEGAKGTEAPENKRAGEEAVRTEASENTLVYDHLCMEEVD